MDFGFLSLLPAIIIIIFALCTKKTFEAILLGTICSYIITDRSHFLFAWIETFFTVARDKDVLWVIIVCSLFGSLMALLKASNGSFAFSRFLSRICKSAKSSLLMTFVLGILIFIDDYLNIIALGGCMTSLSDKHKEPREALAYVIDSTGAPACALLPFSTWAVFYSSIFFREPQIASLGYSNALDAFINVIPYTFYAFFALLITFLFCLKIIPPVGKMKLAYKRVQEDDLKEGNNNHNEKKVVAASNYLDFIIPIFILIILTIVTGEMLVALALSIVTCFIMYLPRKLMTLSNFVSVFIKGFLSMFPIIAVVFVAFIMQHAACDIGLPSFIIDVVKPHMSRELFPAISFAVVSVLTFVTGSNWGIPAVCIPIIIPLGHALGVNPLLSMASILSGGVFGSHACFYSDATILTSKACEINNLDHALTQIPYALLCALLAFVTYIIFGFML